MFLSFSGNIYPLLYKRKASFDCVPHASARLTCKNFAPICDFKMASLLAIQIQKDYTVTLATQTEIRMTFFYQVVVYS